MYSPFASCSEYESDDESSKDVAKVLLPFYHDTSRTYPFDTSPPTNRPSVDAVWSSPNAHIFKGTPTFDHSTNPSVTYVERPAPAPTKPPPKSPSILLKDQPPTNTLTQLWKEVDPNSKPRPTPKLKPAPKKMEEEKKTTKKRKKKKEEDYEYDLDFEPRRKPPPPSPDIPIPDIYKPIKKSTSIKLKDTPANTVSPGKEHEVNQTNAKEVNPVNPEIRRSQEEIASLSPDKCSEY